MGLVGLSQINIELQARCNKRTLCFFCGHQNKEINPGRKGEMSLAFIRKLIPQLPFGIVIQFHRDGEPTAYLKLGEVLKMFRYHLTSIVTHGENLMEKADDIINRCTTVTVSAFKGDPDADLQFNVLKEFLELKKKRPPMVNLKIVGESTPEMDERYGTLGIPIIRRLLHVPDGNYRYARRNPTVPEHGMCMDFLSHPSIDWRGFLHVCNRLDTNDESLLGDLNEHSLEELWNGWKRMNWLDAHKQGQRDKAAPICKTCIFYGVASG